MSNGVIVTDLNADLLFSWYAAVCAGQICQMVRLEICQKTPHHYICDVKFDMLCVLAPTLGVSRNVGKSRQSESEFCSIIN